MRESNIAGVKEMPEHCFSVPEHRKKLPGGFILHCSTTPVNVEEELRWSVALTSKSLSRVTGSLSISPENWIHLVKIDPPEGG